MRVDEAGTIITQIRNSLAQALAKLVKREDIFPDVDEAWSALNELHERLDEGDEFVEYEETWDERRKSMNAHAQLLKEAVDHKRDELNQAELMYHLYQKECNHVWHVRNVPDEITPRWIRTCSECGKTQHTQLSFVLDLDDETVEVPNWKAAMDGDGTRKDPK